MLTTPFADVLTSPEQLRVLYRAPTKVVAEKKLDHLPPWVQVAIQASRFTFVATADAGDGRRCRRRAVATGSPWCSTNAAWRSRDYPGNNLTDSLRNIILNPHVGLIFLVPRP